MRCFGFLCSLFVLAGSVFGFEVLNPPAGDYMIVDGHIISLTVSGNGSSIGFGFGLRVPNFSEAELVDRYIRSHVSSSYLENNGYKGPYEVRNGQSDIVGGYVILVSQNYSDEDYDDILTAVRQCGYSVSDYPDYTFYDLGEAVISNNQPGDDDDDDDDDLPSINEGCITKYEGNWIFTTDGWYIPGDSQRIFVGPSLYAHTEQAALQCASNFANFLANYDWSNNWDGAPTVNLWTQPKVYKCYMFMNGQIVDVFWRIFFQDYSVPGVDVNDNRYGTCLTDYSQGHGGTGGYNVIAFYSGSSNAYSDNLTARSSLAGVQLAQASDYDEGVSSELPQGIVFSQSTTAGVDAAQGDFVGESTVRSTANASTNGTTVNITNNTEINTNLELGETPDDEDYEAEEAEEKEVADSDDLLDEEEPTYTYIDTSSTEYKIDYEKLWEDCKDKIDEIFGTDKLSVFFEHSASGGYIPPWVIQWVDPWVHYNWGFTVDVGAVAAYPIVQTLRSICNFGLYLATLFMSLRLFA